MGLIYKIIYYYAFRLALKNGHPSPKLMAAMLVCLNGFTHLLTVAVIVRRITGVDFIPRFSMTPSMRLFGMTVLALCYYPIYYYLKTHHEAIKQQVEERHITRTQALLLAVVSMFGSLLVGFFSTKNFLGLNF